MSISNTIADKKSLFSNNVIESISINGIIEIGTIYYKINDINFNYSFDSNL
jgi:hypothetical protein